MQKQTFIILALSLWVSLLGCGLAVGPTLAQTIPGANTTVPSAQSGTPSPAPGGQLAAPNAAASAPSSQKQYWNLHGQTTLIFQGDAGFSAKYSGPNSLSPQSQIQHTLTADLFAGARQMASSRSPAGRTSGGLRSRSTALR